MIPLEYRIKNEGESAYLDFKQELYGKAKKAEFLKDILAFSNSITTEKERYIVIGVKEMDGNKEYIGIDPKQLEDIANYQQLIDQNIEPKVPFRIDLLKMEEKTLAIFVIGPCVNPPYVMKKEIQFLKQGNIFIRAGSTTRFVTRQELDMMYDMKQKIQRMHISLGFSEALEDTLEVKAITNKEMRNLPSLIKKREIKSELVSRKESIIPSGIFSFSDIGNFYEAINSLEIPLHQKTDDELEEMLENIDEKYQEHNNFYLYEEISGLFNLYLFNDGSEPLLNTEIKIKIPKVKGLYIAECIHNNPNEDMISRFSLDHYTEYELYPDVTETDEYYIITETINNLRHKKIIKLFNENIRISASPSLVGEEITIKYELFANNFPDKIDGNLKFKIVDKIN